MIGLTDPEQPERLIHKARPSKTYDLYHERCGQFISGNNNPIQPYRCPCGKWEHDDSIFGWKLKDELQQPEDDELQLAMLVRKYGEHCARHGTGYYEHMPAFEEFITACTAYADRRADKRVEEARIEAHRIGYGTGVNDFSNWFMDASIPAQRRHIGIDIKEDLLKSYTPFRYAYFTKPKPIKRATHHPKGGSRRTPGCT